MFTSQQLENYRSKRKVLLDQERLKSFLSTWNIKIQGWKKLTSLCCCNAVITVVCSAVLLKLFHHDKALHNCKPAVQPASGRLFHLMKTNQHQKQTSAFKAPPLHCKAGLWTLRSLFEKASSVRERKYIVAFFFFSCYARCFHHSWWYSVSNKKGLFKSVSRCHKQYIKGLCI